MLSCLTKASQVVHIPNREVIETVWRCLIHQGLKCCGPLQRYSWSTKFLNGWYLLFNAVFSKSSKLTRMWWDLVLRSSMENIGDSRSLSNISYPLGTVTLVHLLIWFRAESSTTAFHMSLFSRKHCHKQTGHILPLIFFMGSRVYMYSVSAACYAGKRWYNCVSGFRTFGSVLNSWWIDDFGGNHRKHPVETPLHMSEIVRQYVDLISNGDGTSPHVDWVLRTWYLSNILWQGSLLFLEAPKFLDTDVTYCDTL